MPGLVAWAAAETGGLVAVVGGVKLAAVAWGLVSSRFDVPVSQTSSAPIV